MQAKPRRRVCKGNISCSVVLDAALRRAVAEKAKREDATFSQIVRRALRRELDLKPRK